MKTNKILFDVIDRHFDGNKSAFCRSAKISRQNLNRFLNTEMKLSRLISLLETAGINFKFEFILQ